MGKKDRKINKKKQQQHQQQKGKKKTSQPDAGGSCRHRGQASVSSCAKVREDKECVVSGCTELDDLRVCLGCGLVACKVHAKRHWAKAQSSGHSLVYLVDAKDESVQVYCYECDRFSTELEGDLAKAVELVRSGGAPEEEEDAGTEGGGQKVAISAKSKPGNGLTNLGNTCFMNSVLQCLAYLPPLLSGDAVSAGPLGSALLTTLGAIWSDNAKKRHSPQDLLKLVRATFAQFRRGTQEDAHELFRSLLDGVDEEFNRKRLQAQSLVRRVFMLETTSVVTCHGCEATFARREDAMDCSVQMVSTSKKSKQQRKKQQQEAADLAAEAEEDESDEEKAILAEEDDGASEADVISIVWPVFLGKRFPIFISEVLPAFLEQAPPPPPPPKTAQSVVAPVVPTRLDEASGRYDARPPANGEEGKRGCAFLEAFTSPELLAGADRYRCGKCNARRRASKQLLLGPRLPRVLAVHFKRFGQDASGNLFKIARAVEGLTGEIEVGGYCVAPPEEGATTRYRLRGVVVHSGQSLRQGHYVAYCSYGAEGKWVMISDTNVRPSSLGEALSSEAYIAFYSQE